MSDNPALLARDRLRRLKTMSPALSKLKIPTAALEKKAAAIESKRRTSSKARAQLAAPSALTDIAASPFTGGIGAVTDLWTMALGSREDKVNTAMDYMPVNDVTEEAVANTIDYSAAQSPSAGAFWGQSVIGTSDTPTSSLLPDIGGDLKQTIIIAGLFLGGIYLAGKILGGK